MDVTDILRSGIDAGEIDFMRDLARQLRRDADRCSTRAGLVPLPSATSSAELAAVLLTRHLRHNRANPTEHNHDHLILSKASPSHLLYAMFKALGAMPDEELVAGALRAGLRLQGGSHLALPWVDVTVASAGQGLPIAVGVARAGAAPNLLPRHVWVLCEDAEMAEDATWGALDAAAQRRLSNLTAIIDLNLGHNGATDIGAHLERYRQRFEAFGWQAIVVDGQDVFQIDRALAAARAGTEWPVAVLARTGKGKGHPEGVTKPSSAIPAMFAAAQSTTGSP